MQIEIDRDGAYPIARVTTTDKGRVPIVGLFDAHVGNPNFQPDLYRKVVQFIKDNDAIWFGGGDLIENNNITSVGAGWVEQTIRPEEQMDFVMASLEPINDQCIGMLKGNHEDRTYKRTGIDPMSIICKQLWGIDTFRYFDTELHAVISSGSRKNNWHGASYSLYASHSGSAGKRIGNVLAAMERDWAFITADMKWKGHDHHLLWAPHPVMGIDKSHSHVYQKNEILVLAGSMIDRPGSYITRKPGEPVITGAVVLWADMRPNAFRIEGEYIT